MQGYLHLCILTISPTYVQGSRASYTCTGKYSKLSGVKGTRDLFYSKIVSELTAFVSHVILDTGGNLATNLDHLFYLTVLTTLSSILRGHSTRSHPTLENIIN